MSLNPRSGIPNILGCWNKDFFQLDDLQQIRNGTRIKSLIFATPTSVRVHVYMNSLKQSE